MAGPLPNVPKVLRIQLFQAIQADLFVLNHLFYSYAGAASFADQAILTENVENAWETNMLPLQSGFTTLQKVVITDLTTTASPQTTVTSGAAGTAAGGALGAGTAAVMSLSQQRRFRGGHARLYIGGLVQPQLATAQTFTAAFVTALTAAFTAIDTAITAPVLATLGARQWVTVSYFSGFTVVTNPTTHRARNVPTLRVGGPLVETIAFFGASSKVASQRRRNLQSR